MLQVTEMFCITFNRKGINNRGPTLHWGTIHVQYTSYVVCILYVETSFYKPCCSNAAQTCFFIFCHHIYAAVIKVAFKQLFALKCPKGGFNNFLTWVIVFFGVRQLVLTKSCVSAPLDRLRGSSVMAAMQSLGATTTVFTTSMLFFLPLTGCSCYFKFQTILNNIFAVFMHNTTTQTH